MKQSLNNNLKLPQLTFTRFIAATAIVIYHDKGLSYPFDGLGIQNFVSFWNCMVSYFFVLLGFILVVSSFKNGFVKVDKKVFWINRFARIYPLYFFALIMYLVLSLNANHKLESLTADKFFLTSLLIQSWSPSHAMDYNGPSWSLSVEMFFYCFFPFLIILFEKLSLSSKALVASLVWAVSLLLYIFFIKDGYSYNFTHYFPLLHLNEFLLGMFTAYVYLSHSDIINHNKKFLLLFLTGSACLTIYLIITHNSFIKEYYANGLFAPLFAVMILYLCTNTNSIRKYLGHRLAVYLGEISYGVYILQI